MQHGLLHMQKKHLSQRYTKSFITFLHMSQLEHIFPVYIHSLQCLHCFLNYVSDIKQKVFQIRNIRDVNTRDFLSDCILSLLMIFFNGELVYLVPSSLHSNIIEKTSNPWDRCECTQILMHLCTPNMQIQSVISYKRQICCPVQQNSSGLVKPITKLS